MTSKIIIEDRDEKGSSLIDFFLLTEVSISNSFSKVIFKILA